LLGAVAGQARAGHTDSVPDVDILNFALTLEYLEASFYTAALGGAGTTGVPASAGVFSDDEITDSKIFAGFGGRIRSTAYRYLTDIRDHEVTHVDFLVGAIPDEAGAQIATVEARHAAYLNLINGDSPFPNAFDMGKLPSQIIAAVVATGFVKGCPPEVLALFSRLP